MELTPEQLKFLNSITGDPNKLKKILKGGATSNFKTKYDVEFTSGLKCPYCSNGQFVGGPLWTNYDYTKFVCKRCKNIWEIKLVTGNIKQLIENLKNIKKEKNVSTEEIPEDNTDEQGLPDIT